MSIKLGLSLDPEIERVLDARCVGLSTERPAYAAEGLIRWETDTHQFMFFNSEQQWLPLFSFIQTDPFVQGLIQSVGSDLSEIHRRLNDSFPDVYRRLEHIEEDNLSGIYGTLDFIDERSRQMKDRIEELETMIVNNEQRNEQLHQRIESFISRLNALEGDAHPHGDTNVNTDGDPPLSVV